MIHQYKLNGYNIVLDICSGSVHCVDDVAYDIISLYEAKQKSDILSEMKDKYLGIDGITESDIEECYDQITELKDPAFYGGILCPACSLIHGRIGDSVYPLTAMYDYSGDEKYLNAAKLAVEWSEANVARKTGGYFNDKAHTWMGISVFSALESTLRE